MKRTQQIKHRLSETEGTGIKFIIFSAMLFASNLCIASSLHLFSIENTENTYQGVLLDSGNNTLSKVEGYIVDDIFLGVEQSFKSSDEGTGAIDSSDEGTGAIDSSDEGTGAIDSSDEGTGAIDSSDEGTGAIDSSDEGTGTLITIDLTCSNEGKFFTEVESTSAVNTFNLNKLYLNGSEVKCNF